MDTVVLKFGGSSVSDNIKLNIVADKIIELYKNNNVVVVVSAQGKTTDKLLKEAHELSNIPNDRELDVLLSTGEQISISKLSILLNRLGYPCISLTGWQAGILTNNTNQNAIIESIDTSRIDKELAERKIVVIAGFQGINEKLDITTLGRGGSDTTAVAIASSLKAKHCLIFSDVDGVYTTDPNKITVAKKLETLSYVEMLDIASEGAKVLHNRCIEVGQKFKIPIVTKSTFNNKAGTIIQEKIEDTKVKSIVKNDNLILVNLKYETYSIRLYNQIYKCLLHNSIVPINFTNLSTHSLDIQFIMKSDNLYKLQNLIETELKDFISTFSNITRISIIGYGIMNNDSILKDVIKILELNELDPINIETNESKIVLTFKEKISNHILEQLHNKLID